jgi:hypothetical protein
MPVVMFIGTGGYALATGDKLTITATYDNTSGRPLRDGAMGIVVGYFVPKEPKALAGLRHEAKARSGAEGMSHDH